MRRCAPVWLALLASLAAGARAAPVATSATQAVEKGGVSRLPARGPAVAPVTVEFFCSYVDATCAAVDGVLARLSDRHPERLRIVYRQAPRASPHYARTLAEAAVEAHAQGKFFELQAELYRQVGKLTRTPDIVRAAGRAGLDEEALDSALKTGRHRARVDDDLARREELGATAAPGTPVLFWNGRLTHTALVDLEEYERAYDDAYGKAQTALASGVEPAGLYDHFLHAALAERERLQDEQFGAGHAIDLYAERAVIASEGAPARGPVEAEVTLVVFIDFEEPQAQRFQKVLRDLDGKFPGKLRIVFKHFPLPFHASARLAAEAGACADRQGKFWAFHDLVLAKGPVRIARNDLLKHAGEAGLDMDAFTAALDGGRCAPEVDADLDEGARLGVQVTPTVFVNGLKLVDKRSFKDLSYVIEEELEPGLLEQLTPPPL